MNLVQPDGVTISFVTSEESICKVTVDGQSFEDTSPTKRHEIKIDGLEADIQFTMGTWNNHTPLKPIPCRAQETSLFFPIPVIRVAAVAGAKEICTEQMLIS